MDIGRIKTTNSSFWRLSLLSWVSDHAILYSCWAKISSEARCIDPNGCYRLTMIYITEQTDWYRVSKQQVLKNGGGSFLSQFNGSLIRALRALYPGQRWKYWRFAVPHHVPKGKANYSKTQYFLYQEIKKVSHSSIFTYPSDFYWFSNRIQLSVSLLS